MKHRIPIIALLMLSMSGYAQIKVGNNPTSINSNAMLEIETTNKGFLLPRVALTATSNVAPLTAHVAGMVIYNTADTTDVIAGFYYNDGSKWVPISKANTVLNGTANPTAAKVRMVIFT